MNEPMSGDTAIWVYGVTRVGAEPPAVTGVDDEPVRLVRAGDLAAAVGPVPLREFGEEALRRNLEDLGWLEAKARSHHQVIAAFAEADAFVPMQLAVIYADEERVRQMLTESEAELSASLTRLSGRSEWGVKVFADRPSQRPSSDASAEEAPTSGTAYLTRRRADLATREEARNSLAATAEEIYHSFRRLAVAGRRHAPQDPQLSGDPREMLLNAAYLVDDGRSEEFASAVTALGDTHAVEIELTGPWPPYSFSGEAPTGAA